MPDNIILPPRYACGIRMHHESPHPIPSHTHYHESPHPIPSHPCRAVPRDGPVTNSHLPLFPHCTGILRSPPFQFILHLCGPPLFLPRPSLEGRQCVCRCVCVSVCLCVSVFLCVCVSVGLRCLCTCCLCTCCLCVCVFCVQCLAQPPSVVLDCILSPLTSGL